MDSENKTIVVSIVMAGVTILAAIGALLLGNMYAPYDGNACERACGAGRVAECGKTIKCAEGSK